MRYGLTILALVAASGPAPSSVSAQGSALAPVPSRPAVNANPGVSLQESYTVHLTSAWPSYPSDTAACSNDAHEAVSGELARNGNRYAGTLQRRTSLDFCGTHGDVAERCTVTLAAEGPVDAAGEVFLENGRPTLLLAWKPKAGQGAVAATGTCPPDFVEKVETMYRTVSRHVEFGLPAAGSRPRAERLDDYGWTLEIE